MKIALGIALIIVLAIHVAYSSLCLKQAARFRYLSTRTVYLSLGYVFASTAVTALLVGTYIWFLLS